MAVPSSWRKWLDVALDIRLHASEDRAAAWHAGGGREREGRPDSEKDRHAAKDYANGHEMESGQGDYNASDEFAIRGKLDLLAGEAADFVATIDKDAASDIDLTSLAQSYARNFADCNWNIHVKWLESILPLAQSAPPEAAEDKRSFAEAVNRICQVAGLRIMGLKAEVGNPYGGGKHIGPGTLLYVRTQGKTGSLKLRVSRPGGGGSATLGFYSLDRVWVEPFLDQRLAAEPGVKSSPTREAT